MSLRASSVNVFGYLAGEYAFFVVNLQIGKDCEYNDNKGNAQEGL